MDIVSITDIYSAVAYVAALIIEAENVSGFNGIQFHMDTVIGLGRSSTVQTVAELLIHIPDKTGAVEALFWAFSTVEIVVAHKLAGKIGDILA